MTAVIFAILSLSCYMACYSLSTERITSSNNSKVKTNFRATLKGFKKNKPLIWILIASLAIMTCFMLTGAVNVYLFKDYFGSAKALSMMGLIQTATIFITMPLIKPLVARFGKKKPPQRVCF